MGADSYLIKAEIKARCFVPANATVREMRAAMQVALISVAKQGFFHLEVGGLAFPEEPTPALKAAEAPSVSVDSSTKRMSDKLPRGFKGPMGRITLPLNGVDSEARDYLLHIAARADCTPDVAAAIVIRQASRGEMVPSDGLDRVRAIKLREESKPQLKGGMRNETAV
jgi:hypothetical protein